MKTIGNYSTTKPTHEGQLFLSDLRLLKPNTELVYHHPADTDNIQLIEVKIKLCTESYISRKIKKLRRWHVYFRYENGKEEDAAAAIFGLSRAPKTFQEALVGKYIQDRWLTLKETPNA